MLRLLDKIRRPQIRTVPPDDLLPLLTRCNGRVHLGCNTVRVEGFVNVDVRPTPATDFTHDCKDVSIFPDKSIRFLYSNAFFEHVYMNDRVPLLKDICRALDENGQMLFTGLPDFEGIARAYLEKRTPGHVSKVFDLYEAYRYTHGDPEGEPSWWLAQLHKGLLDAETIERLLRTAGFTTASVFSYRWGDEPHAVTLGCIARKHKQRAPTSIPEIQQVVGSLPSNINYGSVVIKASF